MAESDWEIEEALIGVAEDPKLVKRALGAVERAAQGHGVGLYEALKWTDRRMAEVENMGPSMLQALRAACRAANIPRSVPIRQVTKRLHRTVEVGDRRITRTVEITAPTFAEVNQEAEAERAWLEAGGTVVVEHMTTEAAGRLAEAVVRELGRRGA